MDALNDHEQAQLLKQWWQENGLALMLGLGLAVAAVLGWQLWQGYSTRQAATASGIYEDMQDLLIAKDVEAAGKKADQLESDYGSTPYAALADLALARQLIEAKNTKDAIPRLRWVAEKADDDGLRALGILRLARALWAEKQYDAARVELERKLPAGFASLAAELKGDVLLAQGKRKEANAAYEQALQTAVALEGDDMGQSIAGRDGLRRKLADTQE